MYGFMLLSSLAVPYAEKRAAILLSQDGGSFL